MCFEVWTFKGAVRHRKWTFLRKRLVQMIFVVSDRQLVKLCSITKNLGGICQLVLLLKLQYRQQLWDLQVLTQGGFEVTHSSRCEVVI